MDSPMAKMEQVKPLAPAAHRIIFETDDDAAISAEFRQHRHKKCIKCCGCIAALVLIQAVVLLVLFFTILRVKDPVLKLNSVTFQGLDGSKQFNTGSASAGNFTIVADVSVKNPNVAAFRFGNATTVIYYGGVAVGEGRNPSGTAEARRTVRMNVTADIMIGKLLEVPTFGSDRRAGELRVNSYTTVRGRVKILKIIKKHVVVRMNCTVSVKLTNMAIQDQDCDKKVSL